MVWFWFALAIALLVVEIVTTQLVSIWFSIGAGVSAIVVAIVNSSGGSIDLVWQVLIFALVSGVLLLSTRKLAKKLVKRNKNQETNLELNIGKVAVVTETINNVQGEGAIKINGLEWSARSSDDSIINKDELVIFKEIQGNKAIVERK
ncbi:MAG: NfeD family protein [Clostridia bacterium]|nr:NfeD family protein [Clostridia bacterium]